jgi:homogentisate 1,2-dioxygenase
LGREGFFGPASHMYHRHRPTDWIRFEGDLKPRAFDTTHLGISGPGPWDAFSLLHNAHVKLRSWAMQDSMNLLARNADGDELLFIHQGGGHLFCDYGHLEVREGDYIVIPRSTMWRIESSECRTRACWARTPFSIRPFWISRPSMNASLRSRTKRNGKSR